jgi:excisionase family DNA binding protein
MTDTWMSLSGAAELLGVHPSTVRLWADGGKIPVHRTNGGHRRFLRSEMELWQQAQKGVGLNETDLLVQNALKRTRVQLSEGGLNAEGWYQKLDDEAREQYRRSGRALLQGLMAYQSPEDADSHAEARAIGFEYASIGYRCGLTSLEAVHAFLFFRNTLLESLIAVYESALVNSSHAWGSMLRKINAFTDQIMLTLLETYERYTRSGR